MLCKPTVREGKTASRPQGGDRRPTWVSSRKGAGYIPPNQRNHKNGTMCVSEAGLLSPFWTGSAAAEDTRHLVTSGKNLNVLVPHPPPGGPQPQEEEGGISNQGEPLRGPYWHLGLDALFSRTQVLAHWMPVSPLFSPVTTEKPLQAEERYGAGKRKDRGVARSRGVRARDPVFNFCSTAYPHCAFVHAI